MPRRYIVPVPGTGDTADLQAEARLAVYRATPDDIEARAEEKRTDPDPDAADPQIVEISIEAGEDEADGYLAKGGMTVPLAGADITEILRRRIIDLIVWNLAVSLGQVPVPADESALYLRYLAAARWLSGLSIAQTGGTSGGGSGDVPIVIGDGGVAHARSARPRRGW